jgi:phage I-like protein
MDQQIDFLVASARALHLHYDAADDLEDRAVAWLGDFGRAASRHPDFSRFAPYVEKAIAQAQRGDELSDRVVAERGAEVIQTAEEARSLWQSCKEWWARTFQKQTTAALSTPRSL